MGGTEKPFSCPESGCGASFTNEDRLAVHSRKHDMALSLEAKGGAYVADQTPTPTRFIRNCEEVGLFQDLQNVNPFDETFKKAMETRNGNDTLTVDSHLSSSDDTLHTPHIFPHLAENNSSTVYDEGKEIVDLSMSNTHSGMIVQNFLNEKSDTSKRKSVSVRTPPKLKLLRQNSIDIVEGVTPTIIDLVEIHNLETSKTSKCGKITNSAQIPIISISDSSNKKDDDRSNSVNINKNTSLLKANSLKLISQKSIDLALVNFQNEANQRTIDLHNISIEDIPSLNEIAEKECEPNHIRPKLNNNNNNNRNTTPIVCSLSTFNCELKRNSENESNEESKGEKKGYELLLMLPNGEKKYLKEAVMDKDLLDSDNDNVKKKLKETIVNNQQRDFAKPSVLSENQAKSNFTFSNVFVPCLNKVSPNIMLSNAESNFIVVQKPLQRGPVTILPKLQPAKEAIVKPETRDILQVQKHERLLNNMKLSYKNKRSGNKASDASDNISSPKKNQSFLDRNKAAVSRYRTRKKILNDLIMEQNKKFEEENKDLKLKLLLAMKEIKRLNDLLAERKPS